MVEYIVVGLLVVVALIAVSADGSAMDQLQAAIQHFFKAYSFAISVAPQGP